MNLCILKQSYAVMSIEIDKEMLCSVLPSEPRSVRRAAGIYKEILRSVLPSGLLDYFDVVDVEMRELSRIRLFCQKDR